RFRINNGAVEYQNRFLRSDTYESNLRANRIVVSEFGTHAYPDPCKSIWQRFQSWFSTSTPMTDNDSVNIYPVRDQLYAATETNFIRRIDGDNLETHEKVDLSKYVTINMATAHPHVDPDGTVYNMGSSFGRNGKYHLIKIPNAENPFDNMSIVCSIPMARPLYPAYYHSFAITDNHYVFIEQPLVMSVPTIAMSKVTGSTFADALTWKPEYMATPDANLVTLGYTEASATLGADKSSVELKYEAMTEPGPGVGELPRINYTLNGKKYRYFYSITQTNDFKTNLMKFDTKTKSSVIWAEESAICSEPVFV
ncbi:unnamed protein product, partial [Medioppia subpectinata]